MSWARSVNAMLKLAEDRTEPQVVLEILECGLDLDELDIELPQLWGSSAHRLVRSRWRDGRYISIDNEKFMAHRLAAFYANERWPNTDVGPLHGDYDNRAIANLREVSRADGVAFP